MQGVNYTKSDIIQWINTILPEYKVNSIEGLGTGTSYCLIFNHFKPESIPFKKIQHQAQSYQKANVNFQLLQQAFNKLNIKKTFNIEKLIQNNFYENFQLICFLRQTFENFQNIPRQKSFNNSSNNISLNSSSIKFQQVNSPREQIDIVEFQIHEVKNQIEQQCELSKALLKQQMLKGLLSNQDIPHNIRLKKINELYNFGISEFNSPIKQVLYNTQNNSNKENHQQITDELLVGSQSKTNQSKSYMELLSFNNTSEQENANQTLMKEPGQDQTEKFTFIKNTINQEQPQQNLFQCQQYTFNKGFQEEGVVKKVFQEEQVDSPQKTSNLQDFSSSQQRIFQIQKQNSCIQQLEQSSPEFNKHKENQIIDENSIQNKPEIIETQDSQNVNIQINNEVKICHKVTEQQRKSLNNQTNIFQVQKKNRFSAPIKKPSGTFYFNKPKNQGHISEESQ